MWHTSRRDETRTTNVIFPTVLAVFSVTVSVQLGDSILDVSRSVHYM